MLQSYYNDKAIEAGCDEAGRGCLAGPVFASAVVLPKDFREPLLDDSKKIAEKHRYELREIIQAKAIDWAVVALSPQKIDKINILQASILAMHQSVDLLTTRPEMILVDGNRFKPYWMIPHLCIIKGDGKFASIAAASILAKTYRDDYMQALHHQFPEYNWQQNKGYPTVAHRAAIASHGITIHHRLSYKLLSPEKQSS